MASHDIHRHGHGYTWHRMMYIGMGMAIHCIEKRLRKRGETRVFVGRPSRHLLYDASCFFLQRNLQDDSCLGTAPLKCASSMRSAVFLISRRMPTANAERACTRSGGATKPKKSRRRLKRFTMGGPSRDLPRSPSAFAVGVLRAKKNEGSALVYQRRVHEEHRTAPRGGIDPRRTFKVAPINTTRIYIPRACKYHAPTSGSDLARIDVCIDMPKHMPTHMSTYMP